MNKEQIIKQIKEQTFICDSDNFSKYNRMYEGNAKFAQGFESAHKAYLKLPFWHRVFGKPFASIWWHDHKDQGSVEWIEG